MRAPLTGPVVLLVTLATAAAAWATAPSPLGLPPGVTLEDTPWTYPMPWGVGAIHWPSHVGPSGTAGNLVPDGAPPCHTVGEQAIGWVAPDFEDGDARIVAGYLPHDPTTLRVERQRCNHAPELLGLRAAFWPTTPPPPDRASAQLETTLPGSRPCYPSGRDLLCLDLAGPEPEPFTLIAATDLEALLLPAGGATALYPEIPTTAVGRVWSYDSVLPLADGRVFLRASYALGQGANESLRTWTLNWILERSPAGALTVRLGPTMAWTQQHFPSAFGRAVDDLGVVRLAYLDEAQLLLLIDRQPLLPSGSPGGQGLGLLPLDAPSGYGLLDLTRRLRGDLGQDCLAGGPPSPYGFFSWVPGPDGRLFVALGTADGRMKLSELRVDRDAADLDRDGLPGATERALGTSDLDPDSDGAGSPDGLERALDATDPADPADDRARLTSPHANWSYSELFHSRVPTSPLAFVPQAQPVPYLCQRGRCQDARGAVVFDEPGDEVAPAVAADGATVVWHDGAAVRRRTLATGADEVLATEAQLFASLPPQSTGARGRLIVGPRGYVYLPVDQGALVLGDGPPRLLADRAGLAAEAGLCAFRNPSDPDEHDPLHREVVRDFAVVGFDPADDRLLVRFITSHETWLLSLGVDRPLQVLLRGRDLPEVIVQNPVNVMWSYLAGAAPEQLLPTPYGGYLARWELGVTDFRHAGLGLSGAFQHGTFEGGYSGGWGDSFFVTTGAEDGFRGVFEVVRLEGRIRPGDLVLWHAKLGLPAGLLVSGPRGGALQLSVEPDAAPVIGLGAAADGRLCRVDADGTLWLLDEPDATGFPHRQRRIDNAHDATDCGFDPDGRLSYLATSPARIGRVAGEAVTEWTLDGVSTPLRLAWGANTDEVRVATPEALLCLDWASRTQRSGRFAAAGLAVTRGGWLVALTRGEGRLVRVPDARACDADPEELHPSLWDPDGTAGFTLRTASVAERPDGLIALMLGDASVASGRVVPAPQAFDPRSGERYLLAPYEVAPAFALVPGGAWCDPWADVVPAGAAAPCWTMDPPAGPTQPDGDDTAGGDTLAADDPAPRPRSGGGCAGSGPAAPGLLLALAAWILGRAAVRPARRPR